MSESNYYTEKFWFEQLHLHGEVAGYGKEYYACKIYEDLVFKLTDVPKQGFILLMGTNNCVGFDMLCDFFGRDRCVGFDIANPKNHDRVRLKNVLDLTPEDNFEIAFVHNDIGSFPVTPVAKWAAQDWAAKNVVAGGYLLGRNNFNAAKYPLEQHLERLGFTNTHFLGLAGFLDLSRLEASDIEGHMLSKRNRPALR